MIWVFCFFFYGITRSYKEVEKIILWKNDLRAHKVGFAAFFQAIGNWWEKPCISYVVKYKIEWESNGRKFPILWRKYWYQFPKFSQFKGFHCIVLYYGELMGKHMHFPYDEVHHRMEISWEKNTYTVGKVWVPISHVLPIRWVLLRFSVLWEIVWKPMHFPCNEA